jgi:hypothetical protein
MRKQIRGKYFDRIERTEVVSLLDSIYANVVSLEDIQFLVKYAATVLPPDPREANGLLIWQNIICLQNELTEQREVLCSFASPFSLLDTLFFVLLMSLRLRFLH